MTGERGDPDDPRVFWHRHPVIADLTELDAAGALGGICAIVTERLVQLRNGGAGTGLTGRVNQAALREVTAESQERSYAIVAAVLAAEIDQLAARGETA